VRIRDTSSATGSPSEEPSGPRLFTFAERSFMTSAKRTPSPADTHSSRSRSGFTPSFSRMRLAIRVGNTLMAKRILEKLGVNPERLRLEWVSAGEGVRFAEVMNDLSAKVKSLGPLGSSEGLPVAELVSRMRIAEDLVPYIKLVERERLRVP